MKLSVPRPGAYNLASGTREGSRGPRHEDTGNGQGDAVGTNMSVYDHCPQCRARSQRAAHKDIYRPASRTRQTRHAAPRQLRESLSPRLLLP